MTIGSSRLLGEYCESPCVSDREVESADHLPRVRSLPVSVVGFVPKRMMPVKTPARNTRASGANPSEGLVDDTVKGRRANGTPAEPRPEVVEKQATSTPLRSGLRRVSGMIANVFSSWSTWSAVGNLCSRAAPVPARTESGGKRTLDARVGGVRVTAVVRPLSQVCGVQSA